MRLLLLSILLFVIPLDTTSDKLTITYNNDVLETIDRQQFSLYSGSPFLNVSKLSTLFTQINEEIYQAPTNAKIDSEGNIVSDQVGYRLDEHQFNVLLRESFYKGKPSKVEAPTTRIYSKVTSELLADIYVDKIGSFITYYKEINKERSHNIALSTKAINNHVVFPGETFSFNKIVGERTEGKGYMRAPVIVKGELDEDIGGGICQVSSTLFNAVNISGIQIMERYAHSRTVPYVPPGKDAAVSWWGPDFVFKNKFNEPILIQANSEKGIMQIDIYSADNATLLQE